MGEKIKMELRFQSSLWILFLISAFSLLALKIKNWLHLILNLLIDIQFIFFSEKKNQCCWSPSLIDLFN